MSDRLAEALQECLAALERGEDLEQTLSSYPELETELRPLLRIAMRADQLGSEEVPDEVAARSRARLLAQAEELRASRAGQSFPVWLPRLAAALIIALAILISGTGLYIASAQALPGDTLYPVKRAAEGLRISLAPSSDQKLALSLSYSQRRLDEIRSLLDRGRRSQVRFVGILNERGGDRLDIQGIQVLIQDTTVLETELAIGHVVQVEGTTSPAGYVVAHRIDRGGQVVTGLIQRLAADAILINDSSIEIVELSEIPPGISVGDHVRATVRFERGHSVAVRIERLATATSTPGTPQPTSSPTEETDQEDEEAEDQEMRFEGTVEQQQQARWRIAGRWISITHETEVDGDPGVGDRVEVRAVAGPDGIWIADRIDLIDSEDEEGAEDEREGEEGDADEDAEEVRFEGQVDSIQSSSWVIDGRQVLVDDQTRIDGDPQVGDDVEVRALRRSDGTLYAERIERED